MCLSGNTDCYQPAERRLELTRRCLQVFLKYRNPVTLIAKSHLIARDLDILRDLAALDLVSVHFSVTTLDSDLARIMEPRAAVPARQIEAMRLLSEAGVSTGVSVSPVIPGLTEEEIPAILKDAAANGAGSAVYILVRVPLAVEDLFVEWLVRHMPDRSKKILHRLREIRGGRLSTSDFVSRKRGEGEFAESIRALFDLSCKKSGLSREEIKLATHHFIRNAGFQRRLFSGSLSTTTSCSRNISTPTAPVNHFWFASARSAGIFCSSRGLRRRPGEFPPVRVSQFRLRVPGRGRRSGRRHLRIGSSSCRHADVAPVSPFPAAAEKSSYVNFEA